MTNYIILALCLIVILAYLFEITSRYSRIPGVILLISLGIIIQILVTNTGIEIPNLRPVLPVIGTIGLILIVMEASLDIRLEKNKIGLIIKAVSSAIALFAIFVIILTFILVKFFRYDIIDSLLNSIPLGIISSAVAISSANSLRSDQKEFIVYESSISDIIGILVFDFILINQGAIGWGLINFTLSGLLTIIIAGVLTFGLAILLHKITYHVHYVIILTAVVLVYALAKLIHLPALFLVLVFGLALSNNKLVENTFMKKYVDFEKFRTDVSSFRKILGELTFLVRAFFFIIFGYYTKVRGLFALHNIATGILLTAGIFSIRWFFFRKVLKFSIPAIILFAPRGLITILLFLSIPDVSRIRLINEDVITLVIFLSLAIMTTGNFLSGRRLEQPIERENDVSIRVYNSEDSDFY
jgi:cell volume regulation protein A